MIIIYMEIGFRYNSYFSHFEVEGVIFPPVSGNLMLIKKHLARCRNMLIGCCYDGQIAINGISISSPWCGAPPWSNW